jgi:PKD repeat protein
VTLGCPACKTDYDDATTVAGTSYFYKVTALNVIGQSTNCGEFPIGAAVGAIENACLLPGLTILTDPPNDELDMVPGHDVQHLWIAEPAAFAPNRVVFTLKMQSLTTVPPDTRWPITFNVGATNYTVRMTNSIVDGAPTGTPIFQVGPTAGPFVAADPTSAFLPDGTITIVVPRSTIGNPTTGQQLTGFLVRIAANLVGITITPDNMPDNLGPAGTYTLVGNLPCNNAPVAALSANPLSGDPPLLVNFDASASSDPDSGDAIASYTFDFGDQSAPVTQAGPLISHTYNTNGHFHATVRVTDSHGLVSGNVAGVEIEVELPIDNIVSRKVHGAFTGDIDLLKPDGTGDVECRSGGANRTYTIIYTFDPAFTTTGMASTVDVSPVSGATVNDHQPGPNANQYTVHLRDVVNAQHLFVTLNAVPVHNNNTNSNASLDDVAGRLDVLLGDTNNDKFVNSGDTIQTRNRSGQLADATNFRSDVNVDGTINSGDAIIVRANSGTALPNQSENNPGKK